jgi:hypothetical protein
MLRLGDDSVDGMPSKCIHALLENDPTKVILLNLFSKLVIDL